MIERALAADLSERRPKESALGLPAHLSSGIWADEIDANRAETLRNFPRDDT
jgi:hypothetical protein